MNIFESYVVCTGEISVSGTAAGIEYRFESEKSQRFFRIYNFFFFCAGGRCYYSDPVALFKWFRFKHFISLSKILLLYNICVPGLP